MNWDYIDEITFAGLRLKREQNMGNYKWELELEHNNTGIRFTKIQLETLYNILKSIHNEECGEL